MPDFWTGAAGGLLSGGFGIIGSSLNYLYNKRLAEQQNKYNLDMWKLQADYNSPQQQMQRFEKAGLNPNLIYGQGSNGNMSQAPQMITPEAPDFSEDLRKIGEAFNIEGLRTTVAKRKEAQADAQIAQIAAQQAKEKQEALEQFGYDYKYNVLTGRFEPTYKEDKRVKRFSPAVDYYMDKILLDDYNRNYLVPYRAGLLNYQKQFLAPQIQMQQYEQQHYPTTYWINTVGKGIHAGTELISNFLPTKWIKPLRRPPIRYSNY